MANALTTRLTVVRPVPTMENGVGFWFVIPVLGAFPLRLFMMTNQEETMGFSMHAFLMPVQVRFHYQMSY